jgi:hypothetical protein
LKHFKSMCVCHSRDIIQDKVYAKDVLGRFIFRNSVFVGKYMFSWKHPNQTFLKFEISILCIIVYQILKIPLLQVSKLAEMRSIIPSPLHIR